MKGIWKDNRQAYHIIDRDWDTGSDSEFILI